MREQITPSKLEEIEAKVPSLPRHYKLATSPVSLAISVSDVLGNQNWTGALACLSDAEARFLQTRFALIEAFASMVWYREEAPTAPSEKAAIDYGKFYADYVSLLLYATAEDIASFIVDFLGIEQDMITYFQSKAGSRKNVSSNASKVGVYLQKEYPNHEITKLVFSLHEDTDWEKAMDYRNTWVHDQPPVIRGTGIQNPRKLGRETLEDGTERMYFGASVAPKYTIDELMAIMLGAAHTLSKVLSGIANFIIKERESLGEVFDFEEMSVNLEMPILKPTDSSDVDDSSS